MAIGGMFDKARLFRLCSNLSYLAEVARSNPKHHWINQGAQSFVNSATGQMKAGCVLALASGKITENAPKLEAIGKLLRNNEVCQSPRLPAWSAKPIIIKLYLNQK